MITPRYHREILRTVREFNRRRLTVVFPVATGPRPRARGWDGFYNIRGNTGFLTGTAKEFVVVNYLTNTPSFSDGPMQNHNPDNQMIFRTADIVGGLYA